MPFRERVRRVLGRSTSNSETSSLHKQESRKNSGNVYLPGEAMPKPKYRQPVDKKHKEHLESFNFLNSFGNLTRRKSQTSQYSPMGSRLSSRNNSFTHPGAMPRLPRGHSYIGQVAENADDDTDPINVGASRRQSLISGPSRRHSRELLRPSNLHVLASANDSERQSLHPSTKQATPEPAPHRAFTDAEIAEALKKLNLRVPGGKENAPPTRS